MKLTAVSYSTNAIKRASTIPLQRDMFILEIKVKTSQEAEAVLLIEEKNYANIIKDDILFIKFGDKLNPAEIEIGLLNRFNVIEDSMFFTELPDFESLLIFISGKLPEEYLSGIENISLSLIISETFSPFLDEALLSLSYTL